MICPIRVVHGAMPKMANMGGPGPHEQANPGSEVHPCLGLASASGQSIDSPHLGPDPQLLRSFFS